MQCVNNKLAPLAKNIDISTISMRLMLMVNLRPGIVVNVYFWVRTLDDNTTNIGNCTMISYP